MDENDRTSTPQGDAPFIIIEPDFSEDESCSSSPEPDSQNEEVIFMSLFKECADSMGLADVDNIIGFIKSMQSGEDSAEGDETPTLEYNLHLLKAMLECNSKENKVDLPTYSHVIKMWVKDIRSRSEKASGNASPLEVSNLSDSGDGDTEEQDPNWSHGSYVSGESHSLEASGGDSSHHSLDRMEMINSVADLKLDNKRLQERNQELQRQMEGSEENLKELLADNEWLKQKIINTQTSLAHLEQREADNIKLVNIVEEMKTEHQKLNSSITHRELQLNEVQQELSIAQTCLAKADVDNSQIEEENRAMQVLLVQKEEMLNVQEERRSFLESQLQDYKYQQTTLSQTIEELNEVNENLKLENADLQIYKHSPHPKRGFPLSSTPYRSVAPSLHEELSAQDSVMNRGSPISPFNQRNVELGLPVAEGERISSESFGKILEETNMKINEKHNQIVRELGDMIDQPSPSMSHRSTESSHLLLSERINDKSFQSFESRLSDVFRKKKQLHNENLELSAQVADLKRNIQELEEERRRAMEQSESALLSDGPATSYQPQPISTSESSVQTTPLSPCAISQSESALLSDGPTVSYQPQPISTSESSVQTNPLSPVHEVCDVHAIVHDSFITPLVIPVNEQVVSRATGEASTPCLHSEGLSTTQRRVVNLSRSVVALHDIESVTEPGAPGSANLSSEEDSESAGSAVEGDVVLESLADIKLRHQLLDNQYALLEQRAKQLEIATQPPHWLLSLASNAYNILKGVTLVLFFSVVVLFLIAGFVLVMDALDSCGPYCPHSPVQVVYSMLEPHLQYTRNHVAL